MVFATGLPRLGMMELETKRVRIAPRSSATSFFWQVIEKAAHGEAIQIRVRWRWAAVGGWRGGGRALWARRVSCEETAAP